MTQLIYYVITLHHIRSWETVQRTRSARTGPFASSASSATALPRKR